MYLTVLLAHKILQKFPARTWQILVVSIGIFAVMAYAPADRLQVLFFKETKRYKTDYKKTIAIQSIIPQGAKIASENGWMKVNTMAYLNGYSFYGEISAYKNEQELFAELRRYEIDYLIVYKNSTSRLLSHCKEVSDNKIERIKIYALDCIDR